MLGGKVGKGLVRLLARRFQLSEDVKKLQGTLEEIQCYLHETEKMNIKHDSTKVWLSQIKDVAYDIEDLLEDYNIKSTSIRSYYLSILSYLENSNLELRFQIKINKLNKMLTELMNQTHQLDLMRSSAISGPLANQITPTQLTAHMPSSGLICSDVVGNNIIDDAKCLIESLTKEDGRDNLLVYAIVGMGGIGKTTLNKLIFDDQVITDHFEVKSWIIVSQNYDVIDIMKRIITFASGVEEHCHDLNLLGEKVKNIVEGKRLFMVLDDVWEIERLWMGMLSNLLSCAAKGSRVLINTRNEDVAQQMMAVHFHQVQPLSLEDGWSLLCKSAFPAWEQHEAKDDAWKLKDIGIKLVKKCDGLPLAINVIGRMLSTKNRTREAWEFVLKSSVSEVRGLPEIIHSALYLSYQHLPANIKQCFLYCSLFPEDTYFNIEVILDLWIQEGLIKDEEGISSHDIAKSYFWMLVQRNLLNIHNPYDFPEGSFTMPGLVRSLSRFVMKNESLVFTDENKILNWSGSTTKLRRLSFNCRDDKPIMIPQQARFRAYFSHEYLPLRTLLIFNKSFCKINHHLFNHLCHLRILWLGGTEVRKLPKSLGALKLLKYLNLSETPIKKLPKSLGALKQLKYLNLSGTLIRRLPPKSLGALKQLKYLNLSGTLIRRLPPKSPGALKQLKYLNLSGTLIRRLPPKSLGALEQLKYLNLSGTLIRKMPRTIQTLKNLRTLDVSKCVHLCNLPACIMKLNRICTLYAYDSAIDNLPRGLGSLNEVQFLDFVMPPEDIAQESSTLKELGTLTELRRLRLLKLERVLNRSQAKSVALQDKQHLQLLSLYCSKSSNDDSVNPEVNKEIFEELCPPPQLQHLYIEEYLGSQLPSWLGHAKLKSLLSLIMSGCRNCKQLDGLGLLANLEMLKIKDASSIESIGPELYTTSVPYQNVIFLPKIKVLVLEEMTNLKEWSGLGKTIPAMPHLESLKISKCPKLKSFPEELLEHAAASLREIRILDSGELLLNVVQNLYCLKILEIENIPHLERISGLPALQELHIKDCPGIKFVDLTHHLQRISWKHYDTDTLPEWFSSDGHGDDNKLKAAYLEISCKEELVKKICSKKENEDHEWSKIQHFDEIAVKNKDGCLRLTYTKNTNNLKTGGCFRTCAAW